jgi:DNA-binding response OmpR family regulator
MVMETRAHASPLPGHHGVPRILIVDDEVEHAEICATLLRRRGYKVVVAVSGLQALDLALLLKPDLVLLDLFMPTVDGFSTAASLHEHPETQDVPIIFLSATGDAASWTGEGELGAASFLPKPFHAAELIACVEESLQRRRSAP